MKTITEHLRARLLRDVHTVHPDQQAFAQSRVAELFGIRFKWVVAQAKVRILMGTFRYETHASDVPYWVKATYGLEPSYTTKLQSKLAQYEETGNQEFLVDAFNYILLELTHPVHPAPFFKSTERHE